ncbi:hypothetical protein TcasGA2_TC030976 [Tribolium castaneum]|uniref:Uncharacterized protein n=1 Tax=Tribolium castaneum TaxID=7070 RepID=A0A139W9T9_TRICA|nr:hypothetical protein TcasGA2_TC030976 [Tribolium castaneum]
MSNELRWRDLTPPACHPSPLDLHSKRELGDLNKSSNKSTNAQSLIETKTVHWYKHYL